MTDLRLSLNDRAVAMLQTAASGQYFARDTDLPGFMVLVGKRRKTFVVQGERRKAGKRLSVRMKVAEVGELTTRAARAKAKVILGKIANGVDPRPSRLKLEADAAAADLPSIGNPTLRIAWARYRDGHMKKKDRSEGTINNYRDHDVERLLADWLDEPLSKFGYDPRETNQAKRRIHRQWLPVQNNFLDDGAFSQTLRTANCRSSLAAHQSIKDAPGRELGPGRSAALRLILPPTTGL